MGLALATQTPPGVASATIEMKVNFFKPVRTGEGELSVSGRVTRRGNRVVFADAEALEEDGSVVESATSSLLLITESPRTVNGTM